MTLKLTACGLDLGNGLIKIALDNKASKIPNWSTTSEPKGAINPQSLKAGKAMAFSLEINGQVHYFGQDTLSLAGHQEIDSDKLKPEYIKMMFKAALYRWLDQHRVDPEWLNGRRLNVVCGMPPELYLDGSARNKAEKVYRYVFSQNKPDYIKQPDKPAIPFFTTFGGLKPETLVWGALNKLKPGYTLLVDLGYGTSDLCLLKKGNEGPLKVVSLNNGLLHSHHEANPVRPWESELNVLRGNSLANYANISKAKIRQVARQIPLAQLVVFGGGAGLLDSESVKDMKGYAQTVTMGRDYDEFSNARWFEAISKKAIKSD